MGQQAALIDKGDANPQSRSTAVKRIHSPSSSSDMKAVSQVLAV